MTEEKKKVRERIKYLRGQLDADGKDELDRAVLLKLLSLPEFKVGADRPVYCYVSVGKEVDTRRLMEILWQRRIPVAVPRVEGSCIRFYRIFGMEDLKPGCMGIPEPAGGCPPVDSPLSAVVTPGLAFTENGKRIGYGGGFYDRFFEEQPDHRRIAVAYPFQILPDLPAESSDRRVQILVTGERIYHCGA